MVARAPVLPDAIRACLFDLDGVLTETARVHAAATALGVDPAHCAVFEDAIAGVQAGRAGAFGWVVGVDRVGQAEALHRQGSDRVVADLDELLERP